MVRVDATQYEGWFYEGAGIYRHVWLNQYNNIHIREWVFVHTNVKIDSATVNIETTVENQNLVIINCYRHCILTDRDGKKIGKQQSKLFHLI